MTAPLARSISFLGATSLGLGAMIGAGVFILSGMAAGAAGPALILAFVLNGLIAFVVGCCCAELAAMMPETGGAYVWGKPGLGSFLGYYAGWMSWFAHSIACSLYATAFGSFAVALLQDTTRVEVASAFSTVFAVAVICSFLWLNYRGSGDTGRIELGITAFKILVLLVVATFGLSAIAENPQPLDAYRPFFPEGLRGLWAAMALVFIAFQGYEVIVQSAEEVVTPTTTIPRAILASICVAVVIYVLVAVVMLGATTPPPNQAIYQYLGSLGELGLMEAAGQFVPRGKVVLLVAGLASTASALNATVYGATRIAFAMGRGQDLPEAIARVHPVHRTPHVAIAVTGTVVVLVTLWLPIGVIAAAADIMFLLVFTSVCVTVIRLRRRWPDRERPFRVPLSPWLPGIAATAGLALSLSLFELSPDAWVAAGVWLALGLVVYGARRRLA